MKAWHIFTGETCDDSSLLVFARTKGRAKVRALNAGLWEYGYYPCISAKRAKLWDDMSDGERVIETNGDITPGFPSFYAEEEFEV